MGPLLTDQADDPAAQIEVLKYCYVTTKLADQTDKNLDALLKTQADAFLQNPTFVDLRPGR
jgi:hypothetical protein